jgi:hypothetical protein
VTVVPELLRTAVELVGLSVVVFFPSVSVRLHGLAEVFVSVTGWLKFATKTSPVASATPELELVEVEVEMGAVAAAVTV